VISVLNRSNALRLLFDRRGATAIEFAMVVSPFLLLVGGTLEVGIVYFRAAQLQKVAESASRAVRLSKVASEMTYDQFKANYVCASGGATQKGEFLGTMFDCTRVRIKVVRADDWASSESALASQNFPVQSAKVDLPSPGQIGVLTIAYTSPVLFGGFGEAALRGFSSRINNLATYVTAGKAAFRVEPKA